MTATTTTASEHTAPHPEFFRLPKPGQPGRKGQPGRPAVGDPFFNLSRSFYYEGEKRGYWKLVRIKDKNKSRGVTLIRFQDVFDFVNTQAAKQ
jgi:hypothetical protein